MTLAHRIVLLKDGVIEQQGAPLDLFERPATKFVAGFLGSPQMNFVPCRLDDQALHFAGGRSMPLLPAKAARLDPWRGRALTLGIRPEHFSRADGISPRPGQVRLRVLIDLVQPTGTRAYATFRLGDAEVSAELPAHAVEAPGTELNLLADLDRAILIDPESERVLGSD
jgi:multiple sugar transport system ATP-binding protein